MLSRLAWWLPALLSSTTLSRSPILSWLAHQQLRCPRAPRCASARVRCSPCPLSPVAVVGTRLVAATLALCWLPSARCVVSSCQLPCVRRTRYFLSTLKIVTPTSPFLPVLLAGAPSFLLRCCYASGLPGTSCGRVLLQLSRTELARNSRVPMHRSCSACFSFVTCVLCKSDVMLSLSLAGDCWRQPTSMPTITFGSPLQASAEVLCYQHFQLA